MSEILVIGGGAAGMMAAYAAAKKGHRVTLIEKNEKLGKKIYITGKGRCNVTNAGETAEFFEQVVRNPKSLYSAVYSFDARQTMAFMEEHGCPLKVERGNRVFPVSDHASDVIKACTRAMERAGVQVRLHTKAERLLTENQGEQCRICGVALSGGERLYADAVIVATGGLSYPTTGSDGDGLRFAKELGMGTEPCRPALVPFVVREEWCRRLQGLALKNVAVLLEHGTKTIYSGQGEMLFTHFGVSGPLVLSASSYYANACGKQKTGTEQSDRGKRKTDTEQPDRGKREIDTEQSDRGAPHAKEMALLIDLKPALSHEVLDKRLLREFEENKNRQFKNAVESLFPAKLIPVMVELSGIAGTKPVHEITKEERIRFAALIKALPLTVTGTRGYAEAVITQGGVSVKEINPSTMESKKVKGLYFAGEVLDVDALTGGYNLQIAWATGHLAGESAGLS
ncbi:MAG: NAD(P)/FAD-dependent oxidoreductase [Clostridium sp.]|nr:NAD(P)/FAD-dependent oxidoreductase [Clostridium sp.]